MGNERIESKCIFKELDRVLVNQEFLDALLSSKVSHLNRKESNCAPLLVQCNLELDNVRKPFKFLNFWVRHPQFKEKVRESWHIDFIGNPFTEVHAKLKSLKKSLMEWSKMTYDKFFERVAILEDMIG